MKILFTGASSFTGAWFVRELAAAGHDVTAVLRRKPEDYPDEVRRRRAAQLLEVAAPVFGCSFGDEAFLGLLRDERFDVLCHHAADVTNYRSPDFDAVGAAANNAKNLPAVIEALKAGGSRRIVLTGSVFEGGEGAGSQGLPDFSPYGFSKRLTSETFRYYAGRDGMSLGKFVIPNPFGPFEEPRYTAYLMKNWLDGKTPSCSNPLYVRDNIHVSLLAKAYAAFVASLPDLPNFARINPLGYAESMGAFTLRLAQEMRPRLNLPCEVELKVQTAFPEPRVRINTDVVDGEALGWDEPAAWDAMAEYYLQGRGA
ncbi:NAD-dependent epimerase/dehydratase family protein [Paludisphaera mucosa]|uniref:NAD(P)-dependent oxidoreductase n=1 Tax=Paludisphaera mucosa TaxID=3030827 RepID=A0ABT6FL93_9BACT|nr:NAD(P)-dependent oxidoreductase [Paludisphaera mucosa]MDG3008128.1 NAD(P)-dependent oxidoreductase [Paludisphaera mucosa]